MSEKDYSQIKFIDGTYTPQSYAVVGRQKNNVLGVRPLGMQQANMQGTDKVFVFCRLRSASGAGLFDEAYEGSEDGGGGGVVLFASKASSKDWASLWPKIKFEKQGDQRASSIFGAYIDGNVVAEPEAFAQKINDEKILEGMANAVINAIGEENLCVRKSLFVSWFIEEQGKLMKAVLDHCIEKKKKTAEFAAIAGDGTFGSHYGTLAENNKPKKGAQDIDPIAMLAGAGATVLSIHGDNDHVELDPQFADLLKAQVNEDTIFNETTDEAKKSTAMFGTQFDLGGTSTSPSLATEGYDPAAEPGDDTDWEDGDDWEDEEDSPDEDVAADAPEDKANDL